MRTARHGPRAFLLGGILVGCLAAAPAVAHHELDPCDLGGSAGGGEVGDPPIACSLLEPPFSFGTSASIGSDGFAAGGSDFARRKLVIESHAESGSATIQEIVSPLDPERVLAEAAAWSRTTSNDFALGVYAEDLDTAPGDPFSGTQEAAEAYAAVRYDLVNVQGPYLDLPIRIEGSFGGNQTTGDAKMQITFRDFHGNLLGVFFARSNLQIAGATWRELVCEDPLGGCPDFTDHDAPWPGGIERTLRLPAQLPDNGLWVAMTASARTNSEQPARADFRSSARITAAPGPDEQVILASGQVFGEAPPSTTPFELFAQAAGPDDASVVHLGSDPEELSALGQDGQALVRAVPGRGRVYVAESEAIGEKGFAFSSPRAGFNWEDEVVFSGADSFVFEYEVDGTGSVVGPTFPNASVDCDLFLGIGETLQSSTTWTWTARLEGEECGDGATSSGGSCLEVEHRLEDDVLLETPFGVDPNEGPVVLRYQWPLSGAAALFSGFVCSGRVEGDEDDGDSGTVDLLADFGTQGGFTLRDVTGVDELGEPVPGAQVLSATGHDYATPAPGLEPLLVPEPVAGALGGAVLLGLGALRRRASPRRAPGRRSPPRPPRPATRPGLR